MNISVPRGGVIAGRVLDEFGDPVTGAQVVPMRSVFQQRRRQLQQAGNAQSNDIGEFRLFGLMPGQYYIAANLRSNPPVLVVNGTPQMADDQSGYATTYYPGTTDSTAATRLTIAAGQTISASRCRCCQRASRKSPGRHAASIKGSAIRIVAQPVNPQDAIPIAPGPGNGSRRRRTI